MSLDLMQVAEVVGVVVTAGTSAALGASRAVNSKLAALVRQELEAERPALLKLLRAEFRSEMKTAVREHVREATEAYQREVSRLRGLVEALYLFTGNAPPPAPDAPSEDKRNE